MGSIIGKFNINLWYTSKINDHLDFLLRTMKWQVNYSILLKCHNSYIPTGYLKDLKKYVVKNTHCECLKNQILNHVNNPCIKSMKRVINNMKFETKGSY